MGPSPSDPQKGGSSTMNVSPSGECANRSWRRKWFNVGRRHFHRLTHRAGFACSLAELLRTAPVCFMAVTRLYFTALLAPVTVARPPAYTDDGPFGPPAGTSAQVPMPPARCWNEPRRRTNAQTE